jgi:lipoprotein-releasing system ATP-binding protein
MITLQNISHKYENELVLKNINLTIEQGSFVALIGESGSGKTTLLSILSTLLRPTNGKIYFEDTHYTKIKNIDNFRQHNIGFIFQFHYLINYLNVLENIKLAKHDATKEEIIGLLKLLHIEELQDAYPNEISGGQRQRVAIARALVNKPKIIFADEPTGNLDSKNSLNIFQIFQKLNQNGTTLVVATHDKDLANLADKIIEVKDGQL